MKQYDTIPYYGDFWGSEIIAFDKLDGSNLRFEYSPKRGFYKFGTRKMMIGFDNEPFGFAVDMFLEKYADGFSKVFKGKTYRNDLSAICFAELVGKRSGFGQHDFKNDQFDIVLFDVDVYKKGFVSPKQFIDDFGHLGIPRVVYEGNLNRELVADVKNNVYDLSEGVICKGKKAVGKKGNERIFYCKIKTNDWFDRLRSKDPVAYDMEMKDVKE